MFCPNCGNPVEETAKFCSKCGGAIAAPEAAPAYNAAPAYDEGATQLLDDPATELMSENKAAPVYEAPAYEAPQAPAYEAPQAPAYEAPQAPAYEAPAYTAPSYNAPSYEAPQAPTYQTPVYQPAQPAAENKLGKIFSLISMICGIVSLVFCWIPFIMELPAAAGVVLGIIGIKKGGSKGKCIPGIILGAIAFVIILIVSFAIGFESAYYY